MYKNRNVYRTQTDKAEHTVHIYIGLIVKSNPMLGLQSVQKRALQHSSRIWKNGF